jgi:hypothetical protein
MSIHTVITDFHNAGLADSFLRAETYTMLSEIKAIFILRYQLYCFTEMARLDPTTFVSGAFPELFYGLGYPVFLDVL